MNVKVERFSVFYLEVDESQKQVAIQMDERNFKLMPVEKLKAHYREVTNRLLHYGKAGYEVDDSALKKIYEKVIRATRGSDKGVEPRR